MDWVKLASCLSKVGGVRERDDCERRRSGRKGGLAEVASVTLGLEEGRSS